MQKQTSDKVLALTHHYGFNDEFEFSVKNQIVEPVLNNDTFTIINYFCKSKEAGKKTSDEYFKTINRVVLRLLQTYKHSQNYSLIEDKVRKDIEKEIKNKDIFIDERWYPLELSCEIDAYLTKWKSTLDTLVKSLKPLYSTHTLTFERHSKYSFMINAEIKTRLPVADRKKLEPICSVIENNAESIKKIIKLRDDVVHRGFLCLTPFHYHKPKDNLYPPNLIWDGRQYKPQEFMKQTIELLRDFVREFISATLNSLTDNMKIKIDGKDYQWILLDSKKSTT